jgi:hypothetical protein
LFCWCGTGADGVGDDGGDDDGGGMGKLQILVVMMVLVIVMVLLALVMMELAPVLVLVMIELMLVVVGKLQIMVVVLFTLVLMVISWDCVLDHDDLATMLVTLALLELDSRLGNVGRGHCPLGLRDGVTEEKTPGEESFIALDCMATFLGEGKLRNITTTYQI